MGWRGGWGDDGWGGGGVGVMMSGVEGGGPATDRRSSLLASEEWRT